MLYLLNINLKLISITFLTLIFLTCITNTCAKNDIKTQENLNSTNQSSTSNSSLEISEKSYKKEAILKFNDAVKQWESKSALSAIALWNDALKIDSSLWVVYLGLGQAYDSLQEYSKSLESYKNYLKLAPREAPDRQSVEETVKYLTHLLRLGEDKLKEDNYLSLVKTKHQGKEHYVRWDLSNDKPLKIYFYPTNGVENYRNEFQGAFLEGAMMWQEALPDLKFEVLDNETPKNLSEKEAKKKESAVIDQAQVKVVFPSRFKVKGSPNNPLASQIDAQSFPIIRDKKNFRVLGVIMISPFIYYQAQIAIPLEPLSTLSSDDQLKKIKIIAAREVGHVLGLWGFSPNPDDLMFDGEVKELKLSDRDKNTIKKLYELDPEKEEIVTNN